MDLLIALLILLSDFFSKQWVLANLVYAAATRFLPGLLQFRYVWNTGAAFSILTGQRWFLVVIASLAAAALLLFRRKITGDKPLMRVIWGLVFGGTVGNLIDRIRFGYVIDFLEFDFITFPVFNIADSALVIGMGLYLSLTVYEIYKEGNTNGAV
ncbi:MAG: signal peptidase II [Negativicutes bacterium]|nr:signal peptidase II [Negativicutes bacterium]